MYQGFVVKVLTWKYDGDIATVCTSRQWLHRPLGEMLTILRDDFLPTDDEAPNEEEENDPDGALAIEKVVAERPKLKSLQVCDTMMDALLRAIDEVEHNKDFVQQAQTMGELANRGIAYAKVELEAIAMARDIARNR
jgi:hypothetical protein